MACDKSLNTFPWDVQDSRGQDFGVYIVEVIFVIYQVLDTKEVIQYN